MHELEDNTIDYTDHVLCGGEGMVNELEDDTAGNADNISCAEPSKEVEEGNMPDNNPFGNLGN